MTAPHLGEMMRDEALDLFRDHKPELVDQIKRAILEVALDRGEVTADDVRPLVAIPEGTDPRVVGTAFKDLRDAGILRREGERNSTRPEAHARELKRWVLADEPAALAMLAQLKRTPPTAPDRPSVSGQAELPFTD